MNADNDLQSARPLPFARAIGHPSMLKITRSTHFGTTTLTLSGRVGSEQLAELGRCVDEERGHGVVLDLREVNLVDVAVVRFLIDCEAQGIRLAQCPGYVQEWMAGEKRPR